MMSPLAERHFTLVLGGGGTRGFAHVGVFEALMHAGLAPVDVVGSSMGALIGAAWCTGTSPDEMRKLIEQLRRADLFQIAHRQMALKRMRSPGLYRPEPLAAVVRGLLGDVTFDTLERPLRISTVDIDTGTQVLWGAPGLTDIPVAEAVIAAVALPGFLPPHAIGGRWYVDGAVAGNLPILPVDGPRDLVIAVDVGTTGLREAPTHEEGFASVWARAIELGIRRMDHELLAAWRSPPLLLVQPAAARTPLLDFTQNLAVADQGRAAMERAITGPVPPPDAVGVYPRGPVLVAVDRATCVGCGACARANPRVFAMDGEGKAMVIEERPEWSPVDRWVVSQCPVGAIHAS
jgi:NTE family protein